MGPWLTASEVPRRLHKYEQSVVSGRQKVKLFTGDVGLHLTTFSSSPSQTQVASLQFGFKKQCKVKSLPCTSSRDGRLCSAMPGLPSLATVPTRGCPTTPHVPRTGSTLRPLPRDGLCSARSQQHESSRLKAYLQLSKGL